MGFQENLRHYREQAKFTPTEMAKHLKVAYNTYVGYEVRGREPKYTTLCKIADLLQVSTDDLLGRTTNILGKNEDDLLEALNSGKISHACLDVFENEPRPSVAILNHPKISLTPHIGAATNEAQERIGVELAEKLISALN